MKQPFGPHRIGSAGFRSTFRQIHQIGGFGNPGAVASSATGTERQTPAVSKVDHLDPVTDRPTGPPPPGKTPPLLCSDRPQTRGWRRPNLGGSTPSWRRSAMTSTAGHPAPRSGWIRHPHHRLDPDPDRSGPARLLDPLPRSFSDRAGLVAGRPTRRNSPEPWRSSRWTGSPPTKPPPPKSSRRGYRNETLPELAQFYV